MIRKGIAYLFLTLILLSNAVSKVEANYLEHYRDILISKNYTIRYENITPSTRITNKDRMELFGSSGMAVNQNEYLKNKIKYGIVIGNGENRYEEVGDGNFNMCRLTIGSENFLFTKYKKNNRIEYYGTKKNKVEANSRNYLAEIVEGQSYGDPDMSWLLNSILSTNICVANGKLSNGLNYEDYKSTNNDYLNAIRYYFEDDKLIKIAAVSYKKAINDKVIGNKCIIKINEFSSIPDKKFLSLPEEIEDVTKRKK